jgi:hypothetical protein
MSEIFPDSGKVKDWNEVPGTEEFSVKIPPAANSRACCSRVASLEVEPALI